MLTYVQAHQFDTDRLGPGQDEYDGVAMPSFDSPRAAAALVDEPLFVDNIRPDEPLFQDLPRVIFFITEEDVIVSRPPIGAGSAFTSSSLCAATEIPTGRARTMSDSACGSERCVTR